MLPNTCEKNWMDSNKTVFEKRLLSIPGRRYSKQEGKDTGQLSPLEYQRHANGPGTLSVKSPWECGHHSHCSHAFVESQYTRIALFEGLTSKSRLFLDLNFIS
jgi:hypothetical protein